MSKNIRLVATIWCPYLARPLKLPGVRSKFKTKFFFFFFSKLQNVLKMFPVAIHSHCIKEKMYKFRIPRKNQHWVYFYYSNLKVGPFGPPPVALGLILSIYLVTKTGYYNWLQPITLTGYNLLLHYNLNIQGSGNESHFLVRPTQSRVYL